VLLRCVLLRCVLLRCVLLRLCTAGWLFTGASRTLLLLLVVVVLVVVLLLLLLTKAVRVRQRGQPLWSCLAPCGQDPCMMQVGEPDEHCIACRVLLGLCHQAADLHHCLKVHAPSTDKCSTGGAKGPCYSPLQFVMLGCGCGRLWIYCAGFVAAMSELAAAWGWSGSAVPPDSPYVVRQSKNNRYVSASWGCLCACGGRTQPRRESVTEGRGRDAAKHCTALPAPQPRHILRCACMRLLCCRQRPLEGLLQLLVEESSPELPPWFITIDTLAQHLSTTPSRSVDRHCLPDCLIITAVLYPSSRLPGQLLSVVCSRAGVPLVVWLW
jgi:hypothetical protein